LIRNPCANVAWSDQQGNRSAVLGVDLNKLGSTAHRLLINEMPDIGRYLVEIRPHLKLLPNSIDIEADDLGAQPRCPLKNHKTQMRLSTRPDDLAD